MTSRILPPFDDATVASLNAYQSGAHPLKCEHSISTGCRGIIIYRKQGGYCSECGRTTRFAWDWQLSAEKQTA